MAGTAGAPETRLTYHIRDGVLIGTAGGRPVHAMIQGGGPGRGFSPGQYQVLAATHSVLGRIAIVESALAGAFTLPAGSPTRNVLAGAFTIPAGNPQGNVLAGGLIGLLVPAVHSEEFPGSNVLAVLGGYEELMDGLASSGRGVLEVVA